MEFHTPASFKTPGEVGGWLAGFPGIHSCKAITFWPQLALWTASELSYVAQAFSPLTLLFPSLTLPTSHPGGWGVREGWTVIAHKPETCVWTQPFILRYRGQDEQNKRKYTQISCPENVTINISSFRSICGTGNLMDFSDPSVFH